MLRRDTIKLLVIIHEKLYIPTGKNHSSILYYILHGYNRTSQCSILQSPCIIAKRKSVSLTYPLKPLLLSSRLVLGCGFSFQDHRAYLITSNGQLS